MHATLSGLVQAPSKPTASPSSQTRASESTQLSRDWFTPHQADRTGCHHASKKKRENAHDTLGTGSGPMQTVRYLGQGKRSQAIAGKQKHLCDTSAKGNDPEQLQANGNTCAIPRQRETIPSNCWQTEALVRHLGQGKRSQAIAGKQKHMCDTSVKGEVPKQLLANRDTCAIAGKQKPLCGTSAKGHFFVVF